MANVIELLSRSIYQKFWVAGWQRVAQQLPEAVTPNHVTFARLILALISTLLIIWHSKHPQPGVMVANLIIVTVALVTDALDGAIARLRNAATAWGGILDASADKFIILPSLFYTALSYERLLPLFFILFGLELVHTVVGLLAGNIKRFILPIRLEANLPGRLKMLGVSSATLLGLTGLIDPNPFGAQVLPTIRWSLEFAVGMAALSLLLHIEWNPKTPVSS
jgi:phosphatidylglycerophosphate synthase